MYFSFLHSDAIFIDKDIPQPKLIWEMETDVNETRNKETFEVKQNELKEEVNKNRYVHYKKERTSIANWWS